MNEMQQPRMENDPVVGATESSNTTSLTKRNCLMNNSTLTQKSKLSIENVSIIESNLSEEAVQTVNARELHEFLEVKSRYNDWFKNRISEYDFNQHIDFVSVTKNLVSGGKQIEHYISLDMAKELSMVERNQKGKEARQYFIACEKKSKTVIDPMQALNDPAAMRGLLLNYSEKVIALEETLKEATPKVEAFERIALADGAMNLTNSAKHLQMKPKVFIGMLSENKYIYKRAGGKSWIGYQDKIQQGLLTHKVVTVLKDDGSEKICEQVLVTPKGLTKLAEFVTCQ